MVAQHSIHQLIYMTAAGKLYSLGKQWMSQLPHSTRGGPVLLTSRVMVTGGLALFPAANKLLFVSDRASLCELDMESKECRVIIANLEPEACRLRTWNDHHALLTVPSATGLSFYSCSLEGEVQPLQSTDALAADADFCVNSRGDVLFFEQGGKNGLPCLRCLPRLLPPTLPTLPAEPSASKQAVQNSVE